MAAHQAPYIRDIMTPMPVHVGPDDQVETAQELFEKHNIHHLPVVDGNKVVGLLSKPQLGLVLSHYAKLGARAAIRMRDIVHEVPYLVQPEARLDEVASEMATRGCSAAVIVEGVHPKGIFTISDACRWIGEHFRQ